MLHRIPVAGVDKFWPMIIVAVYIVVYLTSLTFVYVEGDDAITMAYHALGRNADLQASFAPYQRMSDVILSVLPSDENFIRITAISTNAIVVILMMILMLALVFDWLGKTDVSHWAAVFIILTASPEFFYLGLVYTPAVVAMSSMLAAHLLLRRIIKPSGMPDFKRRSHMVIIALSLILFGFGVAFRWNMIIYGAVITADLVFFARPMAEHPLKPIRNRLIFAGTWGFLALCATLLAIFASGVSPQGLLDKGADVSAETSGQTGIVMNANAFNRYTIATALSLITPACGVLAVIGFFWLAKQRSILVGVVVISLIVVARWFQMGTPKNLLPAVPALLACELVGFRVLWYKLPTKPLLHIFRFATVVALILPWVIGIRVSTSDSAWGPEFELQAFNRESHDGNTYGLGIGEGTAFPTPEGPRSLFGHAMALFGGGWRQLTTDMHNERVIALEEAREHQLPLFFAAVPAYAVALLDDKGFETKDSEIQEHYNENVVTRCFEHDSGEIIWLLEYEISGEGDPEQMSKFLASTDSNTIVLYAFPRFIRSLYEISPTAIQPLGNTTAIVNMGQLREDFENLEAEDIVGP